MSDKSRKRILILGGGFAGVKCARTLTKHLPPGEYEIVLFNRENHMVFHPLLAEVASAAVQPKDVAAPLRQLLRGVKCRTEDVLSIDITENKVEYEGYDGKRRSMDYEHVVISCGTTSNLALVPGMDDHAFALKTVGDALALQAHIMEMLEKAEVCEDELMKRYYLSFIVVGGGFSGAEVAGEINDLVRKSRKFFSTITEKDITVTVVHSGDHILPEMSLSLRTFAERKMKEAGVSMQLNAVAAAATSEGVILKNGTILSAATIVCTIGTTTLPVINRIDLPKERGRLKTEADMSLPGFPNAWAIGDCAAVVNAMDGKLSPPVAQFAERQGTQVALNVIRRLKGEPTQPFSYKMMGAMCSIGGRNAIAEMMGLRVSGLPAWFVWRGVYLFKLPSFSQQMKVGMEWMFDLIFPRTLAHMKADRSRRVGRAYHPTGDYIFHEGDPATEFYVIQQGQVEVVKGNIAHDGEEILAILGPGDFFGEGALLDSGARSASIRARSNVEVTVLGRNVFTQISSCLAPLRDAVAQAMKRRTNIWKSLPEAKEILETIPLSCLIEPMNHPPLKPTDPVETAIELINIHRLDFICVVNDQDLLVGIVSRSDLFRAIELAVQDRSLRVCVRDIMVPEPIFISEGESTGLALACMREHGLKKLPVVESRDYPILKGAVRVENILDNLVKLWLAGELLVATQPVAEATRSKS